MRPAQLLTNKTIIMDFEIFGMNPWMPFMALFAFGSVISFFNVNSAWSDKIGQPKGNRTFIIVGVVLGLVAIFCLYKLVTTSTGTGG